MAVDFGKLLKDRRKRLGINQEELAKRIKKLKRTYLSKLENSKSNPSFSTIEKLCKGLGLTLREFFTGVEEKKEPAIVEVYKDKRSKTQIEKYRVKAEMIPIKVVKSFEGFSREKDITKEFTSKYVYVEKDMFYHPEDIIGVEIEKEFRIFNIVFKKAILLIDIVNKDIKDDIYIVDLGEKLGASIQQLVDV